MRSLLKTDEDEIVRWWGYTALALIGAYFVANLTFYGVKGAPETEGTPILIGTPLEQVERRLLSDEYPMRLGDFRMPTIGWQSTDKLHCKRRSGSCDGVKFKRLSARYFSYARPKGFFWDQVAKTKTNAFLVTYQLEQQANGKTLISYHLHSCIEHGARSSTRRRRGRIHDWRAYEMSGCGSALYVMFMLPFDHIFRRWAVEELDRKMLRFAKWVSLPDAVGVELAQSLSGR